MTNLSPDHVAAIASRAAADWVTRELRDEASLLARRARAAKAREAQEARALPWTGFGDYLGAVAKAAQAGEVDRRLVRSPTGLGEKDLPGGGFLIPPEYEKQLVQSMYAESVVAKLCNRLEIVKPDGRYPAITESSRADGSRAGGSLAYWPDEGGQPPFSLPRFGAIAFSAKKVVALIPVTSELFADVPLLASHVMTSFAAELSFQIDRKILFGPGTGTFVGAASGPGTITVAKATGQEAGTITGDNISAMWSRLPAPCRKRAVWVVNEDAEQQLDRLAAPGTAGSTAGMYFPAGVGGNPYPLLKGRPVLVAEQCPTLGAPGDIILGDFSQYMLFDRGLRSNLSLDVLWTSGQAVFRFVWRGDGKPIWPTPIAPYNGAATRSPFVILAQR